MSSYGFRSQAQRLAQSAWRNKYRIVIGGGLLYTSSLYAALWLAAKERDRIRENTFLYWRIFPGAIVRPSCSAIPGNDAAACECLLFLGATGRGTHIQKHIGLDSILE